MMGRLLQGVGVLAVLGVLGIGVGALAIVRDRVHVVVSDGSDPSAMAVALLRDDVRAIDERLAGIAQGLGDHLQRGLESVDAAAAARAAETTARLSVLDELRGSAAATARRLDQLEQSLAALQARASSAERNMASPPAPAADRVVATSAVHVTPAAAAAPPAATAPDAAADPVPAPAATAAPPPSTGAAGSAPAAAPRARFLSFSLPSRAIAFDRTQRFAVVPELSRVGFDAKSTLHDFSGVTSSVRGELRAMLGDPARGFAGNVACAAATLATGVDGRDEAMREHLDTKAHADIAFRIDGFTPDADGVDAAARRVRGTVRGTMTIRGVAREMSMPVRLVVDDSQRLVVEGEAALLLPDYSVPVPSQLGVIGMEPEVRIWIALRLRLLGDDK